MALQQGKRATSFDYQRQFLARLADTGDGHALARARVGFVSLLLTDADVSEAAHLLDQVEDNVVRWFGKDSEDYADVLDMRVRLAWRRSDHKAALRSAQSRVAVLEGLSGKGFDKFSARCQLARTMAESGQRSAAVAVFEKALAGDVKGLRRTICEEEFAQVLVMLRQNKRAISILEGLLDGSRRDYALMPIVLLAKAYASENRMKDSFRLFREAIALAQEAQQRLGVVVFSRDFGARLAAAGRFTEAHAVLAKVIDEQADDDPIRIGAAFAAWSMLHKRSGQPEVARRYRARAIAAVGDGCRVVSEACRRYSRLLDATATSRDNTSENR